MDTGAIATTTANTNTANTDDSTIDTDTTAINETTATIVQQLEINQAIIENIVGDIVK